VRRSNYQLSTLVAQMLRRLTANGLARDKALAEDLIRDLDSRLCPHAPTRPEAPNIPTAVQERVTRNDGRRAYGAPNWRGK
jgi:hypothetical protein